VLNAFINWDLLTVGLSTLGLACWASRRQTLAGVLLGPAVAAKLYPIVFFVPLLALCWRAGRLWPLVKTAAAAEAAWLAVNLPVLVAAPGGWSWFYAFSRGRGADWGSIWYLLHVERLTPLSGAGAGTLNLVAGAATALGLGLVAALAAAAPRRPRLPQLLFLAVAAFLLPSKVWSPQYALWLVPLVVLARPRWPAFAVWQAAEVAYFVAIWPYLQLVLGHGSADAGWYFAALLARSGALLLLVCLVVVDVLRPARDVVRTGGVDDPAGGVLDGAADRPAPVLRPAAARKESRPVRLPRGP
jgi:uncharacterized membrane protein